MNLEVLGASGGIGNGVSTTSFLLDGSILLDGGTGVAKLSLAQMSKIDLVLVTHAHMDHIAGISLMLASVIETRKSPVKILAPSIVIDALKTHVFNWEIWPDFSKLPNKDAPVLQFVPMDVGRPRALNEQLMVEAVSLSHTVPSFAYLLTAGQRSLCFCGDTAETEQLWARINELGGVEKLFIELSYPQKKTEIARVSGHHSVESLYSDLQKLESPGQICLMHHKPGFETQIRHDLKTHSLTEQFDLLLVDEGMTIPVL